MAKLNYINSVIGIVKLDRKVISSVANNEKSTLPAILSVVIFGVLVSLMAFLLLRLYSLFIPMYSTGFLAKFQLYSLYLSPITGVVGLFLCLQRY